MSECHIRGCRNLETICKDCGRIVCTKTFHKNQWISVSDALPQVNYEQLLYLSSGSISTGYLSNRRPEIKWYIHNEEEVEVTHWMLLPPSPKE